MGMETKTLTSEVKAFDEKGEGSAIIATLNVIDHDGDVTLPGAFGEQVMQMIGAHDHQSVPIGKATITEKGDDVVAKFNLNLDTDAGRNWYAALKFDVENPPTKGQWSYGFRVVKSDMGEFKDGDVSREVRFLKELQVIEISPVLAGAGIGTTTLRIKEKEPQEIITLADTISKGLYYCGSAIDRLLEVKSIRDDQGRGLSKERLADLDDIKTRLEELEFLMKVNPQDEEHQKALIEFQATKKRLLDIRNSLLQNS